MGALDQMCVKSIVENERKAVAVHIGRSSPIDRHSPDLAARMSHFVPLLPENTSLRAAHRRVMDAVASRRPGAEAFSRQLLFNSTHDT